MNKKQKWFFRISLITNVVFAILIYLNYTAYSYKSGKLKKNIKIGIFNSKDSVYFTLPKGITVRDVSERGLSAIDRFENHRFEIVITSDNYSLVNYGLPENELQIYGNLYSADQN